MRTAATIPSSGRETAFKALIGAAAATVNDGNPDDACRAARAFTQSHPEQPDAWCL